MEQQNILITGMDRIEPVHRHEYGDYEYKKFEVTKRKDRDHAYAAFYEIPPQKANYPYHYHLGSEEIFYIIKGTGILKTPDGDREIAEGDIIFCPAGELSAHKIINTSLTETLIYLDVDAVRTPDVAFYPDSNKVGVIKGKGNLFYKVDSNVRYYEGE